MREIGSDEAKTHLPRLLDEVAAGESITVTKHGRPVAILVPAVSARVSATAAADALRAFRQKHRLQGVRIRDLEIAVVPVELSTATGTVLAVARSHGLGAYDAAYLDLASYRELDLATLDANLSRAAAAAGVTVAT